jgi:hypothetical protein
LPDIKKILANVLNLSVNDLDSISDTFYMLNWELITQVRNGVAGAREELLKAIAKDLTSSEYIKKMSASGQIIAKNIISEMDKTFDKMPTYDIGEKIVLENDEWAQSFL